MKRIAYSNLMLLSLSVLGFTACKKEKVVTPDQETVKGDVVILEGNIETQKLTADKKYLIRGQVFVRDGKVLTIEPGTVIMGEKSSRGTLVIDRGGKIYAEGTVDKPIIMTSNQDPGNRDRGDWGGLLLLGKAPVNQVNPAIEGITPEAIFGGNDPNDNSGVLKYLRVEFAGIELSPNNETNGITLGGVGKGTVIDYCMVSYGGDDGFEWFGGTVDAKHLIVFAGWDDDFDVDYGFSGNVQFGLGIRYRGFADQSESNAFECDNGPNDNDVFPYTTATFSNFTLLGPIATGTSAGNNNFAHAIDLRRRTSVSIFNSVFAGYPKGLRMNQPSVLANYQSQSGVIENNIFYFPNVTFLAGSGVSVDDVKSYIESRNMIVEGAATEAKNRELGIQPEWYFGNRMPNAYPSNPSFGVTSGESASGGDFAHSKLGAFEKVGYRGAFGPTDWTRGWTEFNPIDAKY